MEFVEQDGNKSDDGEEKELEKMKEKIYEQFGSEPVYCDSECSYCASENLQPEESKEKEGGKSKSKHKLISKKQNLSKSHELV